MQAIMTKSPFGFGENRGKLNIRFARDPINEKSEPSVSWQPNKALKKLIKKREILRIDRRIREDEIQRYRSWHLANRNAAHRFGHLRFHELSSSELPFSETGICRLRGQAIELEVRRLEGGFSINRVLFLGVWKTVSFQNTNFIKESHFKITDFITNLKIIFWNYSFKF